MLERVNLQSLTVTAVLSYETACRIRGTFAEVSACADFTPNWRFPVSGPMIEGDAQNGSDVSTNLF